MMTPSSLSLYDGSIRWSLIKGIVSRDNLSLKQVLLNKFILTDLIFFIILRRNAKKILLFRRKTCFLISPEPCVNFLCGQAHDVNVSMRSAPSTVLLFPGRLGKKYNRPRLTALKF